MKRRNGLIALSLAGIMTLTACAPAMDTAEKTTAAPAATTEASADTGAAGTDETPAATEAGGINTTDPITLTMSWWGGDTRHEATQNAINAFMEKYPNIKVETTFSGWSGWEDIMGLAFSSGTAEDIVQINWNWIDGFGANGTNFYDLYQLSDVIDLTQFPENALKASEVDGKLMGVPVSLTARTVFWNQATFAKAGIEIPKTWDELLAAGETFKTVLGDDYYPLMLNEYDRSLFMVYYLQSVYGKEWVTGNQLNYSTEEIAEGFAMLKQLEEAHVIPTVQMTYDYAATLLEQSDRWIDGYWAGVYTWNTSFANLQKALPNPDDFVVGTMFDGFDYKGGMNKISMEFAITSTCKNPVEAAALLDFILNQEEGVLLMENQRGIPASQAGFEILSKNNLLEQMAIDAKEYALEWNQFQMDSNFENAKFKTEGDGLYYRVMSDHSYGNVTDMEAAETLVAGINEVIN